MKEMVDKNITMDDIHFALKYAYQDTVLCLYSDYNSDKLIFRIRLNNLSKKKKTPGTSNASFRSI